MIIAHDLGTTGNKATLVDDSGTLIAAVTVHYPADFDLGGKAEQNPEDWWNALIEATRQLLTKAEVKNTDISVVSFSGQMMGAVYLDGHGVPVRPAMIWADTRSTAQCQSLIDSVGMEHAYQLTGHRLNPTYSLSKIMYIRDTEPDVFAKVSTVLQAKDYLAYRLTGVLVTDPSDASSTNAYDQSSASWSDELVSAAGLKKTLFPEVVASTTVVGHVTREAAALTGMAEGTPVVIGGGDGPTAALGAGIIDENSGAYTYLGSSSWVSISSPQPLHDPQMRSMTFNHVVPGYFVPTATMQAGGASLQWIANVLSPKEDDKYSEILAAAAAVSASAEGLYFLPHLLGERSPYWNPRARAAFIGLLMHHDRGHLARAVLEGVAFNLRTGLNAFTENGHAVSSIDAIGGATNSPLLLQIFADVWGVPVHRRNIAEEANAIGAAIVGGVGVGIFDDFSVASSMSHRTPGRNPEPKNVDSYHNGYATFMDAYRRLEPWFESLPRG
ncbi:xylulokinase [Arthrobacter psychrochitiniphilus]|uniref:Xylulose kinase n=1 Tax=Arthrobacter psychrochitiniphilus TaxID=291045 RepID=A0A2V3DM16_9MICC|nr:xylulokinase [Arthrobacter psychrochitiniphilus]NYG16089.1 xylulokinase [Arthrobacter psychrochitiniphilus]PXA63950.1 xylulokinase [Arthrobacter psychrochitiniphilus]